MSLVILHGLEDRESCEEHVQLDFLLGRGHGVEGTLVKLEIRFSRLR